MLGDWRINTATRMATKVVGAHAWIETDMSLYSKSRNLDHGDQSRTFPAALLLRFTWDDWSVFETC